MNHEDLTLAELQKNNIERINDMRMKGYGPMNSEFIYICRLLEHLAGDDLERIQHEHEVWTAQMLDEFESQLRQAELLNGVVGGNGKVK